MRYFITCGLVLSSGVYLQGAGWENMLKAIPHNFLCQGFKDIRIWFPLSSRVQQLQNAICDRLVWLWEELGPVGYRSSWQMYKREGS